LARPQSLGIYNVGAELTYFPLLTTFLPSCYIKNSGNSPPLLGNTCFSTLLIRHAPPFEAWHQPIGITDPKGFP